MSELLSVPPSLAPGRTAPVGSVTAPRIRPKLACANSATEKSKTTRVVLSAHVIILDLNVPDVIAPPFSNTPLDSQGGAVAPDFRKSLSAQIESVWVAWL